MNKRMTVGIVLSLVALAFIVVASTQGPSQRVPAEFTTLTSTTVNFTTSFNQTTNGETVFNASILNSSTSATSGFDRLTYIVITNATVNDTLVTMKDGERVWWKVNITNATGAPYMSAVQAFDVDTEFLKFQFGGYGKLNLTLNTGLVESDYGIKVGGNANSVNCAAATRGLIIYNATHGFVGCTSDGWKSLNGTVV